MLTLGEVLAPFGVNEEQFVEELSRDLQAGPDASASRPETHARTHVILLVQEHDVRGIDAANGELLRGLTIDPDATNPWDDHSDHVADRNDNSRTHEAQVRLSPTSRDTTPCTKRDSRQTSPPPRNPCSGGTRRGL